MTTNAQRQSGFMELGLFSDKKDDGSFLRGDATIDNNTLTGFTNEDFEPTAPLGSGIVVLIGAGLGYVALKKKEDKQ